MLPNQRRLLLVLSVTLGALLLFLWLGPEPAKPTSNQIAEWTVPLDTGAPLNPEYRVVGDPTVDWYVLEASEIIPLDPNDPQGPAIEIVIEEECWMPKASDPYYSI